MRRKNRNVCNAPGCTTIPRIDPLYCYEHRHLRLVDDANHASRQQVLQDRIEQADAEARAWVAGQGPVESTTSRMLKSIESGAERSPAGAVGAWRSASALSKHLEGHEDNLVKTAAERFGKGKYTASDGTVIEIGHARDSIKWDAKSLLDKVDAMVPADAAMPDYVAALRESTSVEYRPRRISEALPGLRPEDVYQSVHDGPMGLRPLDPEKDTSTLGNELDRKEWEQAWTEEMEYQEPPDLPQPSEDLSQEEMADMIRDAQLAREMVRTVLVEDWAARATGEAQPGDVLKDNYGVVSAVVTSGWECHGPQHNIVNAALEQLPDRKSVRAAYEQLARIKGKVGALKKADIDPESMRVKTPGRLRARALPAA